MAPAWWRPSHLPSSGEATVLILKEGLEKDPVLCGKLGQLFSLFGGRMELVRKAYWINNPLLAGQFEMFLDGTAAKHRLNPSAFNSQDWRTSGVDIDLKTMYRAKLEEQLDAGHRILHASGILPVIQGTRENAAHRIAQNGFGTLSSLDPGWYGQGIYFTRKLQYARVYSKPTREKTLVFVISLAAPGNSLPVTASPNSGAHSFKGKPLQHGYQSHFTFVNKQGEGQFGYPLRTAPTRLSFDELVVFEPAQVLPVFVIYVDSEGLCEFCLVLVCFTFSCPFCFLQPSCWQREREARFPRA